jgi:hypothetical protein
VEGDANGDLTVDVLDITTVVTYILNQDPQPFYHYAADVNNDQIVNVVDIVGIIQIISGGTIDNSLSALPVTENSSLFIEENDLMLQNVDKLIALQFEIHLEDYDPGLLKNQIVGFEFSWIESHDKLICLLYSFNQEVLPSGISDILSIPGLESINKAIGVTQDYKVINLMEKGTDLNSLDNFSCTIFPNPISQSSRFQLHLLFEGRIKIDLLDQHGRKIDRIIDNHYDSGHYSIDWKISDSEMTNIATGIYFFKIRYMPSDKNHKGVEKLEKIMIIH